MAGSRRFFQYTSDSGITYAVEIDEENGELADLGFTAIATGGNGPLVQGRVLQASSRRPLRMRYINCVAINADGDTVRRQFWSGTNNNDLFRGNVLTFSLGGLTWSVTSTRGEERQSIPVTDTGLTDGDIDNNFQT